MNFYHKIEQAIKTAQNALDAAEQLKTQYEDLRDFTAAFLACCEKHGIKTVSINTYTELIKSRKSWGRDCPDSAFADEREGTWPAIWAACNEMGVCAGCGNSGQHQINSARLIDGVYKLTDGKWERIEECL